MNRDGRDKPTTLMAQYGSGTPLARRCDYAEVALHVPSKSDSQGGPGTGYGE